MSEHTFRLPANYRTREAISLPIGIVVLLAIGFALARFFPHLIPVPWLVGIGLTLVAVELISIATTGLRLKWTTISVSTTGVELLQGRIWRRRQFHPSALYFLGKRAHRTIGSSFWAHEVIRGQRLEGDLFARPVGSRWPDGSFPA